MSVNFSCLRVRKSLFTNDLYLNLKIVPTKIKKITTTIEEKGETPLTEYGPIFGKFLTWIGFAFQTKDEKGQKLYINKVDFCELLLKLKQIENDENNNYFNNDYLEKKYQLKGIKQETIEGVQQKFDENVTNIKDLNIAETLVNILKKI